MKQEQSVLRIDGHMGMFAVGNLARLCVGDEAGRYRVVGVDERGMTVRKLSWRENAWASLLWRVRHWHAEMLHRWWRLVFWVEDQIKRKAG